MRKSSLVTLVGAAAAAMMTLAAAAAFAATSGAVSLAVTGASFSGTYRYDVAPAGFPNSKGVLYNGTLKNTGSADTHTAYFYAQVSGYGFTQIGRATYHTNAAVNRVVFDPAATKVNTSKAQVCRDRTFLGQNCKVGTYNR